MEATLREPSLAAPVQGLEDRLAAIDIGSNSIHLIVVECHGSSGFRILAREKAMVRLGKSALTRGRLSDKAISAGIETLLRMSTLARWKGASRIVAVATSAVREATNGKDFLELVRHQTGLEVRLLDGLEEARLIFRAVSEALDLGPGYTVIVDVGGGSTEWCLVHGGELVEVASLALGSLRLGTRFTSDPPRERDLARLQREIRSQVAKLPLPRDPIDTFVATSGTAIAFAQLIALRGPAAVTGASLVELSRSSLNQTVARLAQMRKGELEQLPPVGKARADSIVAGGILLAELAAYAGVDQIVVSDRALREGLILDALGRRKPEGELPSATRRHRQVLAVAQRVPGALDHAFQVARLSQRLFDLTSSLHGYGDREREWLEAAALLHDVGCAIHFERHHKHSLYLILSSDLDAFAREEIEILAHVARYHRGALPSNRHESFRMLEPWQRRTVCALGALLRIANALDRTHAARVAEVSAAWRRKRHLKIEVFSPHDVGLELQAADLRADLFRQHFDCQIEFRQGFSPRRGRRSR